MGIAKLTFLGLFLIFSHVCCLEIPRHNCEKYFAYRTQDGEYFGIFTAPRRDTQDFAWRVLFDGNTTSQAHTVGPLQPYPPQDLDSEDIPSAERGQVFVRFRDFGERLPKPMLVELNGEELCRGQGYNIPSISRHHRMTRATRLPSSQGISALAPAAYLNETGYYLDGVRQESKQDVPVAQSYLAPAAFSNFSGTYYYIDGEGWVLQSKFVPRVVGDYDECGREGFATSQIGGEEVTRGQFPWLAALYVGRAEVTYKCVGSLISRRTVVTAAHCVFDRKPFELWVYLGRHDRDLNSEPGAELVGVTSVRTSQQYNGNPLPDTDIGLLVLSDSVVYTRYIQPLCLWSREMSVPGNEGDLGAVAGWGVDKTAQKTRFPKIVYVQLVSRDRCRFKLPRAEDFITDRTVCAGNSRAHGPCYGDSGAGLIVLRNNRWVLRGVVSLSPRNGDICDLSQYAIYCDVSTHLDWISDNMVS